MGHSSGTLVENSCRTLALVRRSCGALLLKSPKVNRRVSKTSVRTRPAPKVTRQVCKASISYETSCKIHSSSLQSERFARGFLKSSRFESAKRAFRTRLPPKFMRQVSSHLTSWVSILWRTGCALLCAAPSALHTFLLLGLTLWIRLGPPPTCTDDAITFFCWALQTARAGAKALRVWKSKTCPAHPDCLNPRIRNARLQTPCGLG